MQIMLDFKCPTGHVFEDLVSSSSRTSRCFCGLTGKRVPSPIRSQLDPISGHFPNATRKWAKSRHQKIQLERKQTS